MWSKRSRQAVQAAPAAAPADPRAPMEYEASALNMRGVGACGLGPVQPVVQAGCQSAVGLVQPVHPLLYFSRTGKSRKKSREPGWTGWTTWTGTALS